MVTNGWHYTRDLHSRLTASGLGLITVSLDGFEASHNWIRGSPQSFSRAVSAIDIVASSHLTYDIVTCVNQGRIRVYFSCEAYTGGYEGKVRDGYFFCHAGVNIGSILYDGSISACPNINRHFIQGNIYRDNFQDVWNNRFEVMRNRGWTKTGVCKKCRDYRNCKGGAMHMWNEKQDGIMRCIHNDISLDKRP
ncbi:MAG: SPASM domain-containing protein [Treponema sp.]|jgi:radical SAM protein with 4Fe4S-binding SPASM domain|nr:SPASM domain-containing protein [Treponema sp.]